MHHLALQISKFSLQIITLYQIATECTIYLPCFQHVLGNSKILFQIASECANQRSYFQKFPDCGQPTSHPLMKSKHVLFFQIVPNTVRMNHLPSLFFSLCSFRLYRMLSEGNMLRPCSHFFCSSISFQIPLESTIYRPCFQNYPLSSISFQVP